MKFSTIVTLGALALVLVNQSKFRKEFFNMANANEQKLDEGLATLKQTMTEVSDGVTKLVDLNQQQAEAIAALKADNPDLEDELATVEELNAQAGAVGAAIKSKLPETTPTDDGSGSGSGDTPTEGQPTEGGETTPANNDDPSNPAPPADSPAESEASPVVE